MVDSALVARLLSPEGINGRRIRFGVHPAFQNLEIVGVARDARLLDIRDGRSSIGHAPCLQHPDYGQYASLLVRADRPAGLERSGPPKSRRSGANTPRARSPWSRRRTGPLRGNARSRRWRASSRLCGCAWRARGCSA